MGAIARTLINIENLLLVFAGPASGAKSCRDLADALCWGHRLALTATRTYISQQLEITTHGLSEMRGTRTSWRSFYCFTSEKTGPEMGNDLPKVS